MSKRYKSQPVADRDEPPFGAYAPRGLQALVLACTRLPPFYRGLFRRPVANLVRRLGRNRTLDITRNGPAGRVLAVDANRDIVPALEFNTKASGLTNVTLVCAAVAEKTGRAHLEIHNDDLAIVEVAEDPRGRHRAALAR